MKKHESNIEDLWDNIKSANLHIWVLFSYPFIQSVFFGWGV